eukprot:s1864_g19.t1
MRLRRQDHVFQLLFADDLKMMAAGQDKYDLIWYLLISWIMVGAPFRWPKFRGGVCLEFVGFYMDYCKFEVGLSERRTNWIVQWVQEVQGNQGLVAHRRFVELVGRLVYASQVLTWVKPLLAPLHAWKSSIRPGTVAVMPQTVSVILLFISEMLTKGYNRTTGRSPKRSGQQEFRTDAKCASDKVVLGGWELGSEHDPKKARWFSLELTPAEAPWLFEGATVQYMSTVAELLATLVAMETFGYFKRGGLPYRLVVEAGTDNLATEHISLKSSTNKFPLAYVQMHLHLKCFFHGLVLRLNWRPRETNQEADDLTNGKYDRFTMSLRCKVTWENLDLDLVKRMLELRSEVREWNERKRQLGKSGGGLTKRQKQESKTKW